MAAHVSSIELLPQEDWEKGTIGSLLKWSLTVGRYIVIVTELVVIFAFFFRFKLDRDLANLNEDIIQKQAQVQASAEFEKSFRFLQHRLKTIDDLKHKQLAANEILNSLAGLIPLDVKISNLKVDREKISFNATSLSEAGLATLINNLKNSSAFTNLSLSQINNDIESGTGIKFELTTSWKNNGS